jgi:hypothetical protein
MFSGPSSVANFGNLIKKVLLVAQFFFFFEIVSHYIQVTLTLDYKSSPG